MPRKSKILISILFLILITSAGVIYWTFFKASNSSRIITNRDQSAPQESIDPAKTPLAHHIESVPYYSELTGNTEGFCYGYSSMMLLEHYGFLKEKVIEFRDLIQKEGRGGPPDVFLGFQELGIADKVHIGYSQGFNPEHAQIYKTFVEDETTQTHILASQDNAKETLKDLISSNTPVMVLINNGTDYDVAIGYNSDYVYLNDPHDKGGANVKLTWTNFLSQWNSEEAGAPGRLAFPGDWGMIWLEK